MDTSTDILKSSNGNKSVKSGTSAREQLYKYIIYLPLFVACIAVAVTAAFIYLRYKVPLYSSSISLLVEDEANSAGGADAVLEGLGVYQKRPNLANEIEILKSVSLMSGVVDSLRLNLQYFSSGNVKKSEIYGDLPFVFTLVSKKEPLTPYSVSINFTANGSFSIEGIKSKLYKSGETVYASFGAFKIDILFPKMLNPEYTYFVVWRPATWVAGELAGALNVRQLSREANILRLSIETEAPGKGRDILNSLINVYNKNTIEQKNKVLDNTIQFVDERLSILAGELGNVERGLQNFRQQNEIINVEKQTDVSYDEIKSAQEKVAEQEVAIGVIDLISNYISNPSNRFSLIPLSSGIENPGLVETVKQYNNLLLEREEKLRTIPAANPIIIALEGQIDKLRSSIAESLRGIRNAAASKRNKTQNEYNTFRGNIQKIPAQDRELQEIMRQQGIKEKLFLFLLQKREESSITRASSVATAYGLDPAVTQMDPVSPVRSSIYRLAIILGILFPVLIIYLKELLNDKIIRRNDIINASDIPVIGEIAHYEGKDRKLIVSFKDRSVLTEQFRMIRTNLQFLAVNKQTPVLLVTSSIAGEGKTFCSMNIGAIWAVTGKRTVIIELDLRKPQISKSLGLKNKKGITNYMLGQCTAEELPVAVEGFENLFVVPAGTIPPNPSELLLDEKIHEFFKYFRQNYDLLVIDSAPIGLVSDAKILSKYADITLYLIRQRYTLKKQMLFIDELYKKDELPRMGIVVNDVKLEGISSYYGYGYGYGYGYRYNYNYSYGNEKKQAFWKRVLSKYTT